MDLWIRCARLRKLYRCSGSLAGRGQSMCSYPVFTWSGVTSVWVHFMGLQGIVENLRDGDRTRIVWRPLEEFWGFLRSVLARSG